MNHEEKLEIAAGIVDYIVDSAGVLKSHRISDTVAIVHVEAGTGPAPNPCEVAADHGVNVKLIADRPRSKCYRVDSTPQQ